MAVYVKFAPWDKVYEFFEWVGGRSVQVDDFKEGDLIIVKTSLGTDIAQIAKIETKEKEDIGRGSDEGTAELVEELRIILRKATAEDLEKVKKREATKTELLDTANELVKKYNLRMKLIDVLTHFDGGRVTFAFIASERADFRELVKSISHQIHKSVRMYQIGARQETASCAYSIGPCGQSLCCQCFLKGTKNVSTELIFHQQLAHRGVDRLLGLCGRLKCCLLYEESLYQELSLSLPTVGSLVTTEQGQGKVVDRHILKETVMVELEKGVIIEVSAKDVKK